MALETLHREKLVVFLPDNHRFAHPASEPISIQSLEDEPFIFYPRPVGSVLYEQIISFYQQAGFSPKIVQEVFLQQTILGLVSAGIGMKQRHASARAIAPQGAVSRPLLEPTPELELAVAWYPALINPFLSAFLQILRQVSGKLSR